MSSTTSFQSLLLVLFFDLLPIQLLDVCCVFSLDLLLFCALGKSILYQLPGLIDVALNGRLCAVAHEIAADLRDGTEEFMDLENGSAASALGSPSTAAVCASSSSFSSAPFARGDFVPKCQVTFIVSPLLSLSMDQVRLCFLPSPSCCSCLFLSFLLVCLFLSV